jgi:hypothetical protein
MAAALLTIGVAGPATSQDATEEQLLACDQIADIMEKLKCFDEVVQGVKQTPAAVPVAEPSPAPVSEAPSAAAPASSATAAGSSTPAPAAAETAPPVQEPASSVAQAPRTEPSAPVAETAAAGVAVTAVATSPPAEVPVDPVDEFGRDSMESEREEEEEPEVEELEQALTAMQAMIVRSWRNNDGRFSVELDNGQVWRETQGSRVGGQVDNDPVFGAPRASRAGLPKVGGSVEVNAAKTGGYRMKIEGIRQTAFVRRTK